MGIQTKQIIFDDAETPNAPPAGPRRPSYNDGDYRDQRNARRGGWSINPYIAIPLLVLALALGGILVYFALRFVDFIAYANGAPSDFDRLLINVVKAALAVGLAGPPIGLALACVGWAARQFVIRYQNNQPANVLGVLLAPRVDREMVREMLREFYAERREWAAHSDYWSLTTLDASRSATDRRELDGAALAGLLGDTPPASPPAPYAPVGDETTIEALLRSGLINRSGNSLLVGTSNGKPYYIELDECSFIANAGQPRVGKSNTATFLTAQVALMPEATISVCDKHGRKPDSLLGYLRPLGDRVNRAAIEISDIIDTIEAWFEVGANRLVEESDRKYPVNFLVIDEFTGMILMELLPPAVLMRLVSGAVEFPKVQTHALIIGHQWTGRLLGNALGAPLRRVTTHRIVHKIDPQDAGFLLPSSVTKQAQTLHKGEALFMGANQTTPVLCQVPLMTPRDLEVVARVFPGAQTVINRPSVAGVAAVSRAPESRETPIDTNVTNDDRPSGNGRLIDISSDKRPALARMLLAKKTPAGGWLYTIRQVQAITNMRTAEVIEQSRIVGRSASPAEAEQ